MSDSISPPLRRLAELHGVQLAYNDASGVRRAATTEALVGVLRALGADIDDQGEDAAEAIRSRERALRSRAIEPVLIAWDGRLPPIEIQTPRNAAGRPIAFELALEDGTERGWTSMASGVWMAAGEASESAEFVRMSVEGPADLPMGYHELRVRIGGAGGAEHRATIFSAPRRVYGAEEDGPKRWGVFAPTYALRRDGDWGIGDFTALRDTGAWAGGFGATLLGALPMLAAFLDGPVFAPSPYTPVSRLFWNELLVDIESLPEFERCAEARERARAMRPRIESLRSGDFVDYRETYRLKRPVLEALAGVFFQEGREDQRGDGLDDRRRAFERAMERDPELEQYARFRALTETLGRTWRAWPQRMRDGDIRESDCDAASLRHHRYTQWAAGAQLDEASRTLREGGVEVYLDLPLGVHPDGFDAWRFQDEFATGLSTGAPPDPLFSGGQNWGFAPPHPERSRERGHGYFLRSVREHLRIGKALRIDHVLGLHRLYWIPPGVSAKEGVYVHYPADEMYAGLSIESHRARARLIGENLGTVPDYINEALADRGLATMHVGMFAIDPGAEQVLRPPPAAALASMNTHDTPMFASFWRGLDIDDRVDLGLLTPEEARDEHAWRQWMRDNVRKWLIRRGAAPEEGADEHDILMGLMVELATSRAEMLLVTLEDLWLEERPQNTPGTHEERVNWRRRFAMDLSTLQTSEWIADDLRRIDEHRRRSD